MPVADEHRSAPGQPLVMIVDITGSTLQYDAPLSQALATDSNVIFRTSPFFREPTAFRMNTLRMDFLPRAAWLADRWPGVVDRRFWKVVQLQGYLSAWPNILREIRSREVHVLHLQWCKLPILDFWIMRMAQKRGLRIVYTIHHPLPEGNKSKYVRMYRKLYRQADALVVLSRVVKQRVLDSVDDSLADKIHVIEHGVLELAYPLPDREEARARFNLEKDAEVALFMGAIRATKGIMDLIDGFNVARRDRPKLRLIIAGSPQQSFLPYRGQIERLGLSKLIQAHPRYISEQLKPAFFAAADVVVLPHRDLGQSAMGMEALAVGKPIIATRAGGLIEVVEEGLNGYAVPAQDPHALAGALCRIFALSASAREAMAAASRELGRDRFDWSVIARKHLTLYHRLAEQ